jgi:hypothetical protein
MTVLRMTREVDYHDIHTPCQNDNIELTEVVSLVITVYFKLILKRISFLMIV